MDPWREWAASSFTDRGILVLKTSPPKSWRSWSSRPLATLFFKKQEPEPTRPGQLMTDHREVFGTEALSCVAPGCQTQGYPKNHSSSQFSFR